MNKIELFQKVATIFSQEGFKLFLVGGSVRDYLLYGDFNDIDVTSDATPDEIKKYLPFEADYTFSKYGNVNFKVEGYKFELTTLREEASYLDSRHPNKIVFTKELNKDYKRRDFTINALYLDSALKVIDFSSGQQDLKDKVIRMIGTPIERIKEDPLRILRAIRFSLDLSFDIEKELGEVIKSNGSLLLNLNKEKIKQELSKFKSNNELIKKEFDKYNISKILDMIY